MQKRKKNQDWKSSNDSPRGQFSFDIEMEFCNLLYKTN